MHDILGTPIDVGLDITVRLAMYPLVVGTSKCCGNDFGASSSQPGPIRTLYGLETTALYGIRNLERS